MIEEKLSWWSRDKTFVDAETKREYHRIWGGLGWPFGGKPGFLVAVAEDLNEDPILQKCHLRVLEEFESLDVWALFQSMIDMRDRLKVFQWYGDNVDDCRRKLLTQFNNEIKTPLLVSRPIYATGPTPLSFYVYKIKKLLQTNSKILHFGENSTLPGRLMEIPPEEMANNVDEYPPVAALGHVVTALTTWNGKPATIKQSMAGKSYTV